jgi:hypothetical protein
MVCGRHMIAATDMHATIEELLEASFLGGPPRGYICRTEATGEQ